MYFHSQWTLETITYFSAELKKLTWFLADEALCTQCIIEVPNHKLRLHLFNWYSQTFSKIIEIAQSYKFNLKGNGHLLHRRLNNQEPYETEVAKIINVLMTKHVGGVIKGDIISF